MRLFTRSVVWFFLAQPIWALAIDLQPNDLVAPQPDKKYLMLSYVGMQNTTFYRNGSVVSTAPYANPVINNQNMILRGASSYNLGNLPGLTYAQFSYGAIQPEGSLANYPSSTGIGDFTVATAIWPYVNHDTRTYFAMAGFLTVPTGSYSNSQPLNLGENRYKTSVQVGFQKPIVGNLDGVLAFDTVWYGGNSQCAAACGSVSNVPLNQKPLTTTQIGSTYKLDETFTFGATYFYVTGGATVINNSYQDNVINTQRFLLTALAYTDIGRFSLQYGRDLAIENGFIQTRLLTVRFSKSF